MALPSGNIHGCYWSDMFFLTKQGSYLTDIRVSILKRGSWIREAKPRDEVESFFSWKSLAGRLHPLLPHTHHVGPGQAGPEGVRRKTPIRLPMAPVRPSQLSHVLPHAWEPLLHSLTCEPAPTHLAGHTVTAWNLFVWARGGTPSWDNSKDSGLEVEASG